MAEDQKVIGVKSLHMGVVSMTEKHLNSDPPSENDLSKIEEAADNFIQSLRNNQTGLDGVETIKGDKDTTLVGTAGTITSLAALDLDLEVYDSRKINNYVLTKDAVNHLFNRLSKMTHRERSAITVLEEGRADLIIAGTIIVRKTMKAFGFSQLTVSNYGLLEGLLMDEAGKRR